MVREGGGVKTCSRRKMESMKEKCGCVEGPHLVFVSRGTSVGVRSRRG